MFYKYKYNYCHTLVSWSPPLMAVPIYGVYLWGFQLFPYSHFIISHSTCINLLSFTVNWTQLPSFIQLVCILFPVSVRLTMAATTELLLAQIKCGKNKYLILYINCRVNCLCV
ncbi:hypothetical protein UPYG_G00214600 [Umbra pygmaea]|uniref:Uncharacterized protein n=1 Tax=Umbra pygmaea TaxID=75934 RepID=A0ABD0X4L7_UMBPY